MGDSTAILAKKTSGKAYGWEQITRLHRLSDEDERLKGQIPFQDPNMGCNTAVISMIPAIWDGHPHFSQGVDMGSKKII